LNPASCSFCELCFEGKAEQFHPDLGGNWDTGYISDQGDPPQEWNVIIEKTSELPLGITLQKCDGCLVVERVSPEGLVTAWNVANPSKAIRPGDSIIRVNDSSEDCNELLRALQTNDKLFIGILRDESSSSPELAETSATTLKESGSTGSERNSEEE
jgi:hypothetical protein